MFLRLVFGFIALSHMAMAQEAVFDVIVVGAGLSGLSAARTVASQGYSVLVLEASERVGGRTWSQKTSCDGWVDNGGQWVGPGMTHILELADSLGVETFDANYEGKCIFIFQGERSEYVGPMNFPLPKEDMKEFHAIEAQLDEMANEVPAGAPWLSPRAEEFDSQTVASWVEQNVKTPGAKYLMKVFIEGYFASETKDVSLLHFLMYVRAGNGLKSLHTAGIAKRFVGGAQQLSKKMAEALEESVKFDTPVQQIDQRGQYIIVKTPNGTFETKQVIVAMAPSLASRITYLPKLSPNRDQFTQRSPIGASIKIHAIYPEAFWRKQGYSGMVISQEDPISLIVDNSPEDGVPGILCGFLEGKAARDWSNVSKSDLESLAVNVFVKHFGGEAASPNEMFLVNWQDQPWSRGCFSSIMPPGVWTGFPEVIRKPEGKIHWAGTETAIGWYAYMDGAVSSGQRAAQEVIEALSQ